MVILCLYTTGQYTRQHRRLNVTGEKRVVLVPRRTLSKRSIIVRRVEAVVGYPANRGDACNHHLGSRGGHNSVVVGRAKTAVGHSANGNVEVIDTLK
jgi:hypothetical protein